MKRAPSEQLKTHSTDNQTPVGSESFSVSTDRRSQDFAVKCSELFSAGADTMEIARMLKVPESAVYNAMARLGQ